MRVGVRQGELPPDLADFVLADFPQEEVPIVQEAVGAAADAVECLIAEGAAAAMNRFNGRSALRYTSRSRAGRPRPGAVNPCSR